MSKDYELSTLGVRAGQVRSQFQEHAEALRMRISIWLKMEDWARALKLSSRMCDLYPGESFGFVCIVAPGGFCA